jgi:predicted anti-sigma-YlaC factor YlaD
MKTQYYRIPGKQEIFSIGLGLLLCLLSGCSINRLAINAVADALTGEGSSAVFTGDSDPQLVGDALPFAIKLYESLLDQQPDHQGLILTTGSLLVMYANAFVQGPAEMLPPSRYSERQAALARAKALYLRGVDILYGGLDKKYPGFRGAGAAGTLGAYLGRTKAADVPLLYWLVAGTLSAYSLNPFDLELGMKIRDLTAMIGRAYELDPDFNNGAIDDFYVLFYASLPDSLGGDKSKVALHFERALAKAGGQLVSPYVSYAQAVAIPAQDYAAFKEYLETALALDVNVNPATRLMNILSQRRARYLLDSAPDYFWDLGDNDFWEDFEDEE